MTDSYVYVITALLPLAALMLIFQVNPYHALVMRGILGALAALAYTILGAADVALTEALVGTLLAVLLYAVAVRSSLVLRLGVLQEEAIAPPSATDSTPASPLQQLVADLRRTFAQHHLRVELVPYQDRQDLNQALVAKEVHVICTRSLSPAEETLDQAASLPFQMTTRLRRLHTILQTELVSPCIHLIDLKVADTKVADTKVADTKEGH